MRTHPPAIIETINYTARTCVIIYKYYLFVKHVCIRIILRIVNDIIIIKLRTFIVCPCTYRLENQHDSVQITTRAKRELISGVQDKKKNQNQNQNKTCVFRAKLGRYRYYYHDDKFIGDFIF